LSPSTKPGRLFRNWFSVVLNIMRSAVLRLARSAPVSLCVLFLACGGGESQPGGAGGGPPTAAGAGGGPINGPGGSGSGLGGASGSPASPSGGTTTTPSGGAPSGGTAAGGKAGSNGVAGAGKGGTGTTAAGAGGSGGGNAGSSASAGSGGGTVAACGGNVTVNTSPFGCKFAWGANGNNGDRSSYLDFITTWVGYEDNGGLDGACDGCRLATQLAATNARAVYYAYFIGYGAADDGFGDCNTDPDDQNLCTRGAQWVRDNRALIVQRYSNYSRMTRMASPNKGVVWLLEGDFIQYTYDDQSSPLTMAEMGALGREIVCAIKSNDPNAIVAVNHSSWIRNPVLTNYFNAMPLDILDMVWTTGMGDVPGGYLNDGDANNRMDGSYAYLHTLTKRPILVDTSFGASQAADSWSNTPSATLNMRITDGVIAANVTQPPNDYRTRITNLEPQLSSVCR
jgi:hypothetical protein